MMPNLILKSHRLLTDALHHWDAGCLSTIVVIVLISAAGLEWTRVTPNTAPGWIKFLGLIMGLASNVLAGYVTARAATQFKSLHALIQGIVAMVIGAIVFVSPTHHTDLSTYVISWILSIPMALWGGKIAISQGEE